MVLNRLKSVLNLLLLFSFIDLLYTIPLDYIESRSFCMFYNVLKFTCLGCGFTRAFFSMLNLDIKKAIGYNVMVLMLFPIFVYFCLDMLYKGFVGFVRGSYRSPKIYKCISKSYSMLINS